MGARIPPLLVVILQLAACTGAIPETNEPAEDDGSEPDSGPSGSADSGPSGGADGGGPDSSGLDGGVYANTFACLDAATEIEVVTGHLDEQYDPSTAPGKAFDARLADFLIYQVKWGMISVEGEPSHTGMCWAGGYVQSDKPWDASWADHKDTDTDDGPTRNSASISNASFGMTVTGMDIFNVHDGFRTSSGFDWIVQHNWAAYVRDDCVENDHLNSGRIYDTLFDGCYAGISTRPSSSDSTSDGAGQVIELDNVLLRLQAMPYPYKWETKSGVIDVDGEEYAGQGVPYGHGNFFKIDSDTPRNPHFIINNSVLLATHYTTDEKLDIPPESLLDGCENNTIIWLGAGSFPGALPTSEFPDCFHIVTGQEGRDLWAELVSDWHARHPDVGANRKPTSPGSLEFPLVF